MEIKGTPKGATKMDARIGKYISSTGVIHTIATCGGRRGSFGTSKGTIVTAEDAAWFNEKGISHQFCARCC